MNELLGLPFSPWSEKARWALDVRQVSYVSRTYMPLIGEPLLRLKLRQWTGNVTVPVLTTDDGKLLRDSADIARWADTHGSGPTLFPRQHDATVSRFVALSEAGLAAGRATSLFRMQRDDEALAEMVPKALRRYPGAARIGGLGIARTLRKYGAQDSTTHERALVAVLDELRAAIGGKSGPLLGSLTFADIAMAQVLAFIEPPKFGLRVGKASRRVFTDATLRERYQDLIAWRDALYDAHRPRPPS